MADAGMAPDQETGLPAGFIVDFATGPIRYKHWQVSIDGRVARLSLDVQENQPLVPGYELKLNSYARCTSISVPGVRPSRIKRCA